MTSTETLTAQEVAEELEDGTFQRWLESMIPEFWSFLWCVILALVVFFVGTKIIKLIKKLVNKSLEFHKVDKTVSTFLESLLTYALYALLLVIILELFGVTTTSISAAIAAAGVTLGLGFQGALSNLAGGILILVGKPFVMGDIIYSKAAGVSGELEVVHISILATTVRDVEGKTIIIPNGTMSNDIITNITRHGKRMINERIGVDYSTDLQQARDILQQMMEDCPYRLKDEPTKTFVADYKDSTIELCFRCWTKTEDYWQARWDMLQELKKRFDAAGVEIAFNQLDVHIKQS